jgi:preprotein translocase subunit SecF
MSALGGIGGRLYRGEVSIDFVSRRKIFYIASGFILLISIVALLVRGLDYSVDFKGGSVFQFSTRGATVTQIESAVTAVDKGADPQATHTGGAVPKWSVQTTKVESFQLGSKIQKAIADSVGLRQSQVSRTFVGSTWGSQVSEKALEGLIAFLVVIVIYLSIAFEWKMASAALVALAHDIVITIGVYALTGFQVSPATVIGLLTILGYSLYDTVVVFDKVRENTAGLTGTRRSTYSDAANLALNQTLVRSINTSLIALLPVAAILITSVTLLGNGELKDLSLVLFVGMLSGTYSSICIATPVLTDLKEREPQYKKLASQVALRNAGGRAALRKARTSGAAGGRAGRGTAVLEVTDDEADADAEPGGGRAAARDGTGGSSRNLGTVTLDGLTANGLDSGGVDRGGLESDDQDADGLDGDEPVTAGRPAGAARGGAARPPGPRQQPRRTTAAKRRPAGKKKRR